MGCGSSKSHGASSMKAYTHTATRDNNTNLALVFIKPHACNHQVIHFVTKQLAEKGLKVLAEGDLSAEEIDKFGIIDQHYSAIATTAMQTLPKDLTVSDKGKAEFRDKFSISWDDAIAQNKVMNSAAAMKHVSVDGNGLHEKWAAQADTRIKLGPGLYTGKVAGPDGDVFVINGFYGAMREKFTKTGSHVHLYVVEFKSAQLPWKKFRGEIIGPTDPTQAPPSSIRGLLLAKWKELGLPAQPNTGDNGVHASAGPIEGLRERLVWLGVEIGADPFGSLLKLANLDNKALEAWMHNEVDTVEGTTGPIFDLTEDIDSPAVLELARKKAGK